MTPPLRLLFVLVVAPLTMAPAARGQDQPLAPRLVICGGGSLPEAVFQRFLKLAGPRPNLVVIPTASAREPHVSELQALWRSRGFSDVRILHATDRDAASSSDFAAPLKTATAVWFGGGSQQRIADAYLDTPVEREVYQVLRRGGVVGGTSAGAAIQSKVMIASGGKAPRISSGLDLLHGSIVDQHFLKRNRISRLLAAVREHPRLVGFGIDEGTALITHDGKAEVVGRSYVLRIESVEGTLKLDAFGDGDAVPLPSEGP